MLNHSLLEEGGTIYTVEGSRKKCLLKVSLKIHNPQFYWKACTLILYLTFSLKCGSHATQWWGWRISQDRAFFFSLLVESYCSIDKLITTIEQHLHSLQIASQADLGLADAYINGDFSLVDKDEGLQNLFMVTQLTWFHL